MSTFGLYLPLSNTICLLNMERPSTQPSIRCKTHADTLDTRSNELILCKRTSTYKGSYVLGKISTLNFFNIIICNTKKMPLDSQCFDYTLADITSLCNKASTRNDFDFCKINALSHCALGQNPGRDRYAHAWKDM